MGMTKNTNTATVTTVMQLFMLSYHTAREDRMTRPEARNAARSYVAGLGVGGKLIPTAAVKDAALAEIDAIEEAMLP